MTTRLLETGFDIKFHALQVIFVRMAVTAGIGSAYMWYKKVPDFPLGPPGVRGLLVLRGAAGTIGLFGLYCKPTPGPSRCHVDADAMQTRFHTWTLQTRPSLRFSCPR